VNFPQNSDPLSNTKSGLIVPSVLIPRHGVVTLFGYGIQVRVDRGHLVLQDGIGGDRRYARLPRVGHGLQRLIVVGSDGMVSLAALRWLADQDAAFVMLDRDGSVLATTGPVRSSDARLRRAQAIALQTGAALQITRELITHKLAGQERVARTKLLDSTTADTIARFRAAVTNAETIDETLNLESQGASAYWAAWRDLPISFPTTDLPRVPDHWRKFDSRKSPLSGSPRIATNPANAILNYLYAVLESETRLAVAALGLDPGRGFWHVDTPARDSLACDLMEPIRPLVDAFVLDWITREPLRRSWFFEQRDGNCRLMGTFAVQLSETAPTWARAVAPIAEWVARALWSPGSKSGHALGPATHLTQRHRRAARGKFSLPLPMPLPRRKNICHGCGKTIRHEHSHCAQCAIAGATERFVDVARSGRDVAHTLEARAKQADTQRQHAKARSSWRASNQPGWPTAEVYSEKIQPLLAGITNSGIASRIGVSRWYAGRIRQGHRPHPRHWQALAQLVGISSDA